jgi:hypothetical protein
MLGNASIVPGIGRMRPDPVVENVEENQIGCTLQA